MRYQVSWGRDVGSATVTSVADLDAVLDTIRPIEDDIAQFVGITALDIDGTTTIPRCWT